MLETIYTYSLEDGKKVEKLFDHPHAMINHMVFPKGEGLPEHFSNSNVYMVIVRGTLTLQLGDQEPHHYQKGELVNIPYKIKMNVGNIHQETLEIFVIKAPTPLKYLEDLKGESKKTP